MVKGILILIIVILVIAGGYYFFTQTTSLTQPASISSSTAVSTNVSNSVSSKTSLIYTIPLSTSANTSDWKVYSNPSLGFSIKYPLNATFEESPGAGFQTVTFNLANLVKGGSWSTLFIQVFPNKSNLQAWVDSDESVGQAPHPLVIQQISVGGEPAYYIGFSVDDGKVFGVTGYSEVAIYVIHNGIGYRISGVVAPGATSINTSSSIGEYETDFKSMLDSLTFN